MSSITASNLSLFDQLVQHVRQNLQAGKTDFELLQDLIDQTLKICSLSKETLQRAFQIQKDPKGLIQLNGKTYRFTYEEETVKSGEHLVQTALAIFQSYLNKDPVNPELLDRLANEASLFENRLKKERNEAEVMAYLQSNFAV